MSRHMCGRYPDDTRNIPQYIERYPNSKTPGRFSIYICVQRIRHEGGRAVIIVRAMFGTVPQPPRTKANGDQVVSCVPALAPCLRLRRRVPGYRPVGLRGAVRISIHSLPRKPGTNISRKIPGRGAENTQNCKTLDACS